LYLLSRFIVTPRGVDLILRLCLTNCKPFVAELSRFQGSLHKSALFGCLSDTPNEGRFGDFRAKRGVSYNFVRQTPTFFPRYSWKRGPDTLPSATRKQPEPRESGARLGLFRLCLQTESKNTRGRGRAKEAQNTRRDQGLAKRSLCFVLSYHARLLVDTATRGSLYLLYLFSPS